MLFSIMAVPFYIPANSTQGSNFSTFSSTFVIFWVIFCLGAFFSLIAFYLKQQFPLNVCCRLMDLMRTNFDLVYCLMHRGHKQPNKNNFPFTARHELTAQGLFLNI